MKDWRHAVIHYIREQARPRDKFGHQARLYRLARQLAQGAPCDEDVLFAAAWLHDLGVFATQMPADPAAWPTWDNVGYAMRQAPELLRQFGFPEDKIPKVVEIIGTHLASSQPLCLEGLVLRDADLLEMLGAAGILRTVSKVGRDTRFSTHADAIRVLRRNLQETPAQLRLPAARALAEPRLALLRNFLAAVDAEGEAGDWS